jgi:hypothetical protein
MPDAIALLPFIPGGSDFEKSRELFRALGFEEQWSHDGYVGFLSGGARFILQDLNEPSFASNLMIKIEVQDLEAWWTAVSGKQLPARFAGLRIKPPTDFPWGREVHFIDLAGVCWHVGTP